MQIRMVKSDTLCALYASGRIDATTCPELEDALNGLMDEGETRIILDLEETIYISSAGLRVILFTAKRLYGTGQFVISGITGNVREILEIAGIPNIIDVYPDPETAKVALAES